MATQRSVLSMGITAPPELQAKLEASTKQALEAGYDFEMIQFDVANLSSEQGRIKEKLLSKRWDGVIVGFGVRGNPELTGIFETLVNTASEILPGIRFGFASSPDDVFPCVVRNFGQSE